MEPIPKLNRAGGRRPIGPLLVALAAMAGVGLLQRQLAAIYARPSAVAKPADAPDHAPRREDAKLFARAIDYSRGRSTAGCCGWKPTDGSPWRRLICCCAGLTPAPIRTY